MSTAITAWEAQAALLLNNVPFSGIGDISGLRGSVGNGALFLSLHTADPGSDNVQSSNETAYTGYERVPIARDGTQWLITPGSKKAGNTGNLVFPLAEVGSPTSVVMYYGIGRDASGDGLLIYSGSLTSSLTVTQNVEPAILATKIVILGV